MVQMLGSTAVWENRFGYRRNLSTVTRAREARQIIALAKEKPASARRPTPFWAARTRPVESSSTTAPSVKSCRRPLFKAHESFRHLRPPITKKAAAQCSIWGRMTTDGVVHRPPRPVCHAAHHARPAHHHQRASWRAKSSMSKS